MEEFMDLEHGKREFLRGYPESIVEAPETEEGQSDQQKGVPAPALQKSPPSGAKIIDLIAPDQLRVGDRPLFEIIRQRRSRRKYSQAFLTVEELSFLLFATQGVQRVTRLKDGSPVASLRTAPSGGARHAFETYLLINRVEGIEPGLYRYLPVNHQLCFLYSDADLPQKVSDGCCGQEFVGEGAVVFIWTAVPYRMEWRYNFGLFASKIIAQDSGHLCQNLYLAAEAIGGGTCAIGAYIQERMDAIVQVDGKEEFTIYVAPVGKTNGKASKNSA
jgi:SagB-type dehydrogenase family enzyme